jgi:hypothetical protein
VPKPKGVPDKPHRGLGAKGAKVPNRATIRTPEVIARAKIKQKDTIDRMKAALSAAGLLSPRPAWRPSKYTPDFCEEIIEHCSGGLSLTSFAAKIEVPYATIGQWCAKFPDFHRALQVAKAKAAAWHDQNGVKIVANGDRGGQGTMVKFYLGHHAREEFGETPSQLTINNNMSASVMNGIDPQKAAEMFRAALRGEPVASPKTIEHDPEEE